MKTLAITILAVLFTVLANAQVEKSEVITLTAKLNTTMALTLDNSPITFEFNTLEDYQEGLGRNRGDYRSAGSISSTSNWKLYYKANNNLMHSDGQTIMPLNNIGVTAEFTGSNTISNSAKYKPIALSQETKELFGHNGWNSNAGSNEDNAFIIYWEMGTQKGDMNKESIFDQDLKKGEYKTEVEFIASEIL